MMRLSTTVVPPEVRLQLHPSIVILLDDLVEKQLRPIIGQIEALRFAHPPSILIDELRTRQRVEAIVLLQHASCDFRALADRYRPIGLGA
jgi:hypothetical protein